MDEYVAKPIKSNELQRLIAATAGRLDRGAAGSEPDGARGEWGDVAAVIDRFGGDAEMAQELAEVFLDDYPGRLAEVRDAVESGEADALRRAAHTLKGSVGTFSQDGAYEAALRLETMGREGDLGDAQAALDVLEGELGRFRPVLKQLADSTAAGPARSSCGVGRASERGR